MILTHPKKEKVSPWSMATPDKPSSKKTNFGSECQAQPTERKQSPEAESTQFWELRPLVGAQAFLQPPPRPQRCPSRQWLSLVLGSTDFLIMYSLSWSKGRSLEAPRPAYGYSARKHLPFIVTCPWGSSQPTHVKPDTQVKRHLSLHDLKCCLFRTVSNTHQFVQEPNHQFVCLVTTLGSLTTTVWTCSLSSRYPL